MVKNMLCSTLPNMKRDSKGFSLVELIVVIVILGVLVGIAVPNLLGYIDRSREAADMANIDAVERAFMIAVTDPSVTINPGNITYKKDGTIQGIGVTLTQQFAKTFGEAGKTNSSPTAAGYKMQPLKSKKYQSKEPVFNFKWGDVGKTYIVVTYTNRVTD